MKSFIADTNGKLSRLVDKHGVGYAVLQKLFRKKDVKINGKRVNCDTQVNKGDKIAGFQIVDISRTKVFVKKGYNIIAAGVGEAIEETPLTYNSVDNLPKKFGGKYDTPKKGVIVINGEQF